MSEFFKDPNWLEVIIGFTAFVVGSFITLFIFVSENKKKALTYNLRHVTTIIDDLENSFKPGIRVTYLGKPVQNVCLQEYEIRNTGNVPILPTDFETPIFFRFSSQPQIFSAEIIRKVPSELNPQVSVNGGSVILQPILLNPGDRLSIQVMVDRKAVGYVETRIAGIRRVMSDDEKTQLPYNVFGISFVLTVLSYLIVFRDGFIRYGDYWRYLWDFFEPSFSSSTTIVFIYIGTVFLLLTIGSGIALFKNWIKSRAF